MNSPRTLWSTDMQDINQKQTVLTPVCMHRLNNLTWVNPFCSCIDNVPNDKFLDWSNLKEFADDNFKLGKNGGKFSKRVENTVGKGEIARYEQFLLFPQCFQKICTADT